MEEFLKYWDEVLGYWVENGNVHPLEEYWDMQKIGLYPELMPEPYIGDPYNCSLLIMNYNPGATHYDLTSEEEQKKYRKNTVHHSGLDDPERMCHHYARNYRERVTAGGYLGRGVDPMYDTSCLTKGGKDWWNKRLDWFKELIPQSNKSPFAIELCGWHSNKWGGVKFTSELLAKLKSLLAPAIEEAIKNSDLGIGICVGAQWSSKVLPAFGYKDVTGEVMGMDNYQRGWKPLGDKRNYCILRNDKGTYIINTWKSKGYNMMDVPKPEYREIERGIIYKIKAHQPL